MDGRTSVALYVIDPSTGALRQAGTTSGLATLDSGGTLTASQVPASIANGLTFQATWNANTNTPTLPPVSTPNPGDYWIVTTAGATALPGAAGPWSVGQVAVFNGTDWDALSMYPLAIGLPVAGASAGDVLYVTLAGNLAYAAPGATSGVQAYSSILGTLVANGAPGTFGLARLLDANQAAAQTALGLGTAAYISSTAGGDLSGTLPSPTVAKVAGTTPGATGLALLETPSTGAAQDALGGGTAGIAVFEASSEADGRTALGLGSIATQAANSVSISGGSITGITDLAIADGGTGSSTAAAATAALAPLTQSSSATPTLAVTDVRMGLSHASPTITVPTLSGAATDWSVSFQNQTAATQTLTLNRSSSDTFNGGSTSVVLSVPAGARASLWKLTSTTAWVGL